MATDTCALCQLLDTVPVSLDIHADDDWRVFIHPEYSRPECLWLVANGHVDGLWGMSDAQAGSFGSIVRDVAGLLREACDGQKVYVVSFGENHDHFHALLITRVDADDGLRGLALVNDHLSKTKKATAAAEAVAAAIRQGLADRLAVDEPSV
ncbi:MAG TPA: hypothetical protein VHB02_14810 [Acidimicrobiales bacterium]|nr:hypothetical protein [Acidimicrobiales bacterium]